MINPFEEIYNQLRDISSSIEWLKRQTSNQVSPPKNKKLFLNVKEAAQVLNCSNKTIYRYVARGLLTPSKAIGRLLFPVKQIETFEERVI